MVPEQLCGLLGGWHFVYPAGSHVFVIENLEERIIGFPMLSVGQERNALAVVADKQVILEAAVEVPPSV